MNLDIPGCSFHHVGYAAADFNASVGLLLSTGFQIEGEEFEDKAQGVRGLFLTLGGLRLELLSDLPGSKTVRPWLSNGELVPYHVAYLVSDIRESIANLEKNGLRIIREPLPSVAFKGKLIAFLSSRSRLIIELVEA